VITCTFPVALPKPTMAIAGKEEANSADDIKRHCNPLIAPSLAMGLAEFSPTPPWLASFRLIKAVWRGSPTGCRPFRTTCQCPPALFESTALVSHSPSRSSVGCSARSPTRLLLFVPLACCLSRVTIAPSLFGLVPHSVACTLVLLLSFGRVPTIRTSSCPCISRTREGGGGMPRSPVPRWSRACRSCRRPCTWAFACTARSTSPSPRTARTRPRARCAAPSSASPPPQSRAPLFTTAAAVHLHVRVAAVRAARVRARHHRGRRRPAPAAPKQCPAVPPENPHFVRKKSHSPLRERAQ